MFRPYYTTWNTTCQINCYMTCTLAQICVPFHTSSISVLTMPHCTWKANRNYDQRSHFTIGTKLDQLLHQTQKVYLGLKRSELISAYLMCVKLSKSKVDTFKSSTDPKAWCPMWKKNCSIDTRHSAIICLVDLPHKQIWNHHCWRYCKEWEGGIYWKPVQKKSMKTKWTYALYKITEGNV